MARFFVDANTLVSGLLFEGNESLLLALARLEQEAADEGVRVHEEPRHGATSSLVESWIVAPLALTGGLAVPFLPRLPSRLVHKLPHPRPGQAALLDLPAEGVKQLVFLPEPADHDGLPEEGDLDVFAPLQPEGLPDPLRERELTGGADLADVRLHDRT